VTERRVERSGTLASGRTSRRAVGVEQRWDEQRALHSHGDPDVDAGVPLDAAVDPGAVELGQLAERQRSRSNEEVVHRWRALAATPQSDDGGHVDLTSQLHDSLGSRSFHRDIEIRPIHLGSLTWLIRTGRPGRHQGMKPTNNPGKSDSPRTSPVRRRRMRPGASQ